MINRISSLFSDIKFRAILCCLIECFLLNHTTTIFSSVEYVLREEEYFSDKSEDQLRILYGRLFTAISISCNIIKILVSLSYDYIGLWIPRIFCHIMQIIGLTFLLIASPETSTIFVWLGYPLFYGGGAGLAYSYFMIIPIFPKRTGLLYGIMGLPVAAAMVWYVAFVNMGDLYKIMFVVWLCCIPFSILHTFLNMPKTKIDLENPRLGWETRNDQIFGKREKINQDDENEGNINDSFEPDNKLTKRTSILSVATENGHNLENILNLEETGNSKNKFKLYLKEVTTLPVICTLVWYFTAKTRQMATTEQYESWLRFKTKDDEEIKLYTEFYDLFLIAGTFLEPLVGFLLDWITLNVIQRKFDSFNDNQAKSLTSGIFMTVASILACLCSIFQFPEDVGASTVLYLVCHVLLISFLYSSRYVALVVNTSPECQGQIIATSTALQLTVPIWVTLSTQLLDKGFDGNYNDLSWIFLGICGFGLIFPVAIVIYRLKQ